MYMGCRHAAGKKMSKDSRGRLGKKGRKGLGLMGAQRG
jgi:hypothetical protein